jgi:hypothetical protein
MFHEGNIARVGSQWQAHWAPSNQANQSNTKQTTKQKLSSTTKAHLENHPTSHRKAASVPTGTCQHASQSATLTVSWRPLAVSPQNASIKQYIVHNLYVHVTRCQWRN